MKELTVISGKGGTGKTTLVGAFASLAQNAVVADCDVDAADLHLILQPSVMEEHQFLGGFTAQIRSELCTGCGECLERCRYDAIHEDFVVDPIRCEGCGVCEHICLFSAVEMHREVAGKWFGSHTRFGPMVHARLGIAQENSGKLVAEVRNRAKAIAIEQGRELIIIDGPPGIGCPVISSITGADLVLIVAEPSQSAREDFMRVLELAKHFKISSAVCVNKYDINESVTNEIESNCRDAGSIFAGVIPYDPGVVAAMVSQKTIIENGGDIAVPATRKIWEEVLRLLET